MRHRLVGLSSMRFLVSELLTNAEAVVDETYFPGVLSHETSHV